jgi:hypothetical protein
MSALTSNRSTLCRDGKQVSHPVAAGVVIYAGALVVLTATGFAAPASTATGLRGLGRARQRIDNSGGADGAASVVVDRGCFAWANAGDVTRADISGPAYAVDDQTVSADDASATRSAIGTILDLDAASVWVQL